MTKLTESDQLCAILDRDLVGFLTAVDSEGQPQTSPIWFIRDGDDIVVFNRAGSPRLASIASNPKVAFNLRGDLRASGTVTVEGTAEIGALPPAKDFPGYVDKYGTEIERIGFDPESFSATYGVGLRVTVTRIRTWGLDNI